MYQQDAELTTAILLHLVYSICNSLLCAIAMPDDNIYHLKLIQNSTFRKMANSRKYY